MNILAINGSHRGERSNSWQLTKAFLAGMGEGGETLEIQELTVSRMNIRPCLGCFSCWGKTPGQCRIPDDMGQVIEKLLWADVAIWSFPLYYFSVPGPLKNLIDRQLPMVLPFMAEDGGETGRGFPSACLPALCTWPMWLQFALWFGNFLEKEVNYHWYRA